MPSSESDLRIEPLGQHHDRAGFLCGIDSLDRYFRTQASQDMRRKANGVFVLTDPHDQAEVLGYYTLCATGVPQGNVPSAARKHIPRYPLVSATLVGRLAIAQARQGERLGSLLLADAVRRAYASAASVGSSMLVVDALNERAAAFYEGHGFVPLPDSLRLILPMHGIGNLLQAHSPIADQRTSP